MCPPALDLAATAISAVGSVVGGLQANAQGKYQARIAERNMALSNEAAEREQQNTRTEAMAHYRKVAQIRGQQRVAAAANGVSLDFGTASDVVADTEALGREDARRIYDRGYERSRGYEIEASNYMAQGQAAKQAGQGALVSSLFQAGSTALSGVSQYKKYKAARG